MEITIEHANKIILFNNQLLNYDKAINFYENLLLDNDNNNINYPFIGYNSSNEYNFKSHSDNPYCIDLTEDDHDQIKKIILSRLKFLRDKKSLELFELQFPGYDKLNDQKI